MLLSSVPTKFPIPFANSAGVGFITQPIPVPSQIGVQLGRASLTDGFPPADFSAIAAGGSPPWGADMNGILFQMTKWDQWVQAGGAGAIVYDASFSSSIGGYPKGALLNVAATNDRFWLSTADNNTSNPDSGGANWTAFPDKIVQQQAGNYQATDTGTQNHAHIALTPATPVASLIGAPIRFRIAFANTVTNPDIIINGSAAITMFNSDGTAIVIGQFPSAGTLVEGKLVSTTDFRVTSPGKPVTSPPPATPFLPGMIFLWGAETPPAGTLECAGQVLLISSYPNLFNVIQNRFPGGDGITTFALPDLRGAFVRGWDHGRGLDPGAAGRTSLPTGGSVVGDHVGGWEQSSIRAADLNGATLSLLGMPGNFADPNLRFPLQEYTEFVAPGGNSTNLVTAPVVGSQNGVTNSQQEGGTNFNLTLCYGIVGQANFSGGGVETRPQNIDLMYVIAY